MTASGLGVPTVSLLVESLQIRIDSETVIGVQELASDFIRRGFSFIFPCDYFVHPCDLESRTTYLGQALPINIVCLCILCLYSNDTPPAPSKPQYVGISPVELGF